MGASMAITNMARGFELLITVAGTAEHRTKRKELSNSTDDGGDTRRHRRGEMRLYTCISRPSTPRISRSFSSCKIPGAAHHGVLRVTTGSQRVRGHGRCHVEGGHGLTRAPPQCRSTGTSFTADRAFMSAERAFIGVPVVYATNLS